MTLRRWFCTLIACFWCTMAAAPAQEDSATASVEVVVRDPQKLQVDDAQVTIVNEDTGAIWKAVSSDKGYRISAVPPGTYRVKVSKQSFVSQVTKNFSLHIGDVAQFEIELTLGSVQEAIEVQASIPLLRQSQTQQGEIIDEVEVKNFPNISRNFVGSIYTLPGVANSYAPTLQDPGVGTGFLSSGFSIGASNGRNNLVTIDGGEDDYGSGTMRDMHVPIDSIKEFQVNRNSFEAGLGFTSGTAINMVTKSGTNEIHGSIAGYFHNRTTDAGDYFDKLGNRGTKPFEQSAIFSATLGGPIRKNHVFFFTAPEFQRLDAATVQSIAGEEEFQGIGSQTNGFDGRSCPGQFTAEQQVTQLCYLTQMANSGGPLSGLGAALLGSPIFSNPLNDPILKALVAQNDGTFDGIPTSPIGSGVRGLPGFSTPRGRYFNWVTQLENSFPQNNFGLRFALMRERDSVAPRPSYSGDEFQTDYTLTGSWTRDAGNGFDNIVRVQVVPSNTASLEAPSPNGSEIDLGNQIQLGTPFSYPYFAHFKRFQLDESLSWTGGAHSVKLGGSWRPDYYSVEEKLWFGGNWKFTDGTFSIFNIAGSDPRLETYNLDHGYMKTGPPSTNLTAVQAFLGGLPTLLLQANPDSNDHWTGWTHLLGLYAQDSWKALRRLTVNFGLRVDYDHEPTPVPHSLRLSPRLGIAWDIGKDHTTVVRAGGGIYVAPDTFMIPFYANILGASGKYVNQNAVVVPIAAWSAQRKGATIATPNPPLTKNDLESLGITIVPPGPNAYGNFIYTMAPGFQPAYTIQASLSIARQMTKNLSLEAGYLMYHSVHVEQVLESNFIQDTSRAIDPFVGPSYTPIPGTTAGEPDGFIFQNNAFSSVGSGTYQGSTISLNQRVYRRLQFQANYTFSHAIDDTSDFSALSTPFRPGQLNRDMSLSDFNITHNFVANAIYTTASSSTRRALAPWVWTKMTVSPIISARSGVPFTLLVPGLQNGTIGHDANARPWHEGRNEGLGAHFVSWDMQVSKTLMSGSERRSLELVAQAQNLLNHTNFAAVNNNFPWNPNYPLPGGGTLQNGPYRVSGFAPKSVVQLSQPLAFTAAYQARRVSLALRISF